MKSIIYYTDNRLDGSKTGEAVKSQLLTIGLPIVSVSLKPLDFGENYTIDAERGYLTMFKQILLALKKSKPGVIYFCEHDCLYPKEHFEFTPSSYMFCYDLNWWKVRKDGLAVHWNAAQVSGLCCDRDTAIEYYENRIKEFNEDTFDRKFEPTIETEYETYWSKTPYIDIRGEWNLTYNKWSLTHFRKKETAVNFETTTIDKIPNWNLSIREVYG